MAVWAWLVERRGYLAAALLGAGAALAAVAILVPRQSVAPQVVAAVATVRPSPSPAPPVTVHVAGAVQNPGVYRLEAGARVEEAIAAAGGFADGADRDSLNLAARLQDGQQVVVRSASTASVPGVPPATGAVGKVRLNSASRLELESLPGIGPVTAQRIAERRERLGPFTSVEQLRDERLVNGPTFERLRDLVTLE